MSCAACQSGSLEKGAAYTTCCALGEATRGHNAVTALVDAEAQSCDCTAETLALTSSPPAFPPPSALRNSYTALDISICSPHAQQAGSDCTQTRHEAKLAYYGAHIPSLLRHNISCTPIVWSANGRPCGDTLIVLRSLSESIAHKRNSVSAEVVYQKLHSSITLEIWKRSPRQIRACWPLAALPDPLDFDPARGPGLPLSCRFLVSVVLGSPLPSACVVSEACDCGRSQPMSHVWLMARSEQLRQLAVQVALGAPFCSVNVGWSVRQELPRGSSRPLGLLPPLLRLLGLCCWPCRAQERGRRDQRLRSV